MDANTKPSGQKLFYGLFLFPLLIAAGMAILLCTVVFLTHEEQNPETLITAIKTGSVSKRWQKAFELSNELNRTQDDLRQTGLMNEIIHILEDRDRYDGQTRSYMALALSHFQNPEAIDALIKSLKDDDGNVQLYAMWSLGLLHATKAEPALATFLKTDNAELRKMASYIIGSLGDEHAVSALLPLLEDNVADVRWNAALSLARLKNDAGRKVLASMLDRKILSTNFELSEEEIEKVMINASKGLALIGSEPNRDLLQKISHDDKSLKVRQAAMDALRFHSASLTLMEKNAV